MRAPTIISLFSGAGGLDYGFEAAGFDTRVCVEFDHDCCETVSSSRSWKVIERDIHKVPTGEMLEVARLRPGEPDLLIGGPPCQPFSKAGYWARGDTKRLDDPRASTLDAYLRVVREAKPRAFVLENVEGLAYSKKDEGLRLLFDAIEEINRRTNSNYRPRFEVLNAADYGVPQLRNRLIMVAARDGTEFKHPAPTHAAVANGLPRYRTAWDALADVRPDRGEELEVRGKWASLLPSIPEGQNYLWHTNRMGGLPLFGWRRRYWSFLLKLAKRLPSWTIQAQPGPAIGPFHWENRKLSVRELCRLQTFPDDVKICGSRLSVQRQLGNAVPSLLAEVIGREIQAQLLGGPAASSEPRLIPPKRKKVPTLEPVRDVPASFRDLIGEHRPHPGTGKGSGARARKRLLSGASRVAIPAPPTRRS
jgi:DNA (cytosine-5)-methyltransferase 1